MRKDMIAASRHKHLVIYDPAAIPQDTPVDPDLEEQDPKPLSATAIANLAERGLALILRIALEDCQADIRLIIEETAEPYLSERAIKAIDGAMLHVPSGKLTVDGIEFLCRPGENRRHSEAVVTEVPAGDYQVQVLNLMPWKNRHRALEIAKKTTRVERTIGKIVSAYTWLGILLFPVNILVAPAAILIVWRSSGWKPSLTTAGAVLLFDALVLAGFWVLKFASRWVPALEKRSGIALAFDSENPDVVVCLHRATGNNIKTAKAMATLAVA